MIAGNLELAEMIQNYKPEDIGKRERERKIVDQKIRGVIAKDEKQKRDKDCQSVEFELTVSCSLLCSLFSITT